eukprot:354122-Chlamydomonas_euryale.AAC.1
MLRDSPPTAGGSAVGSAAAATAIGAAVVGASTTVGASAAIVAVSGTADAIAAAAAGAAAVSAAVAAAAVSATASSVAAAASAAATAAPQPPPMPCICRRRHHRRWPGRQCWAARVRIDWHHDRWGGGVPDTFAATCRVVAGRAGPRGWGQACWSRASRQCSTFQGRARGHERPGWVDDGRFGLTAKSAASSSQVRAWAGGGGLRLGAGGQRWHLDGAAPPSEARRCPRMRTRLRNMEPLTGSPA